MKNGEATSRIDMIKTLKEKGYTLLDLKEVSAEALKKTGTGNINFSLEFGVSEKSIVLFTRQFASTLNAGIPILRCLTILRKQSTSNALRKILLKVDEDIQMGKTLYEAMKEHSSTFSRLYLSTIRVGETSGSLPKVMNQLADSLEARFELKRNVKEAMSYPVFILIFSGVMVFLMIKYLLPTFTPIFENSGLDIPRDYPVTQFLINIGNIAQKIWIIPLIIAIILLIYGIYRLVIHFPKSKIVLDKLIFFFPFFQGFIQMEIFASISSTMGLLISSGVPMLESIRLCADSSNNLFVSNSLLKVQGLLEKGTRLSGAMNKVEIFPLIMLQMVQIGEETGSLDRSFNSTALYFRRELQGSLGAITSLVQPVMMIFVGVAVFFFVMGVFLPIMGISQAYQKQM